MSNKHSKTVGQLLTYLKGLDKQNSSFYFGWDDVIMCITLLRT